MAIDLISIQKVISQQARTHQIKPKAALSSGLSLDLAPVNSKVNDSGLALQAISAIYKSIDTGQEDISQGLEVAVTLILLSELIEGGQPETDKLESFKLKQLLLQLPEVSTLILPDTSTQEAQALAYRHLMLSLLYMCLDSSLPSENEHSAIKTLAEKWENLLPPELCALAQQPLVNCS